MRWIVAAAVLTLAAGCGKSDGSAGRVYVTSEGSGRLTLTLTNLGNAPVDATETPLAIVDSLPKGAQAYGVQGEPGWHSVPEPLPCTSVIRCPGARSAAGIASGAHRCSVTPWRAPRSTT